MENKKCKKCGKSLPNTEDYFYKEGKKLTGKCKECIKSEYKVEKIKDIEKWYSERNTQFKNNWDFKDIKWIYDNYLNITKSELMDYFNNEISYKTLTNIIYKMGLKKISKNDDWSDEDIFKLKKYYPNTSQDDLEKMFQGRTWASIKNKASKLDVKRSNEMLFKINSEAHIGYKFSEERKLNMSRNNCGKNNNAWKGGYTHLKAYFRGCLYEWKMASLKETEYKCYFTNENNNDIQIHHIYKNFTDIMYETFKVCKLDMRNNMDTYTNEELVALRSKFIELHFKYGLGVPMREYIHRTFHCLYKSINNTYEQFEEFKERYYSGELDELLSIKLDEYNQKIAKKKKRNKLNEDKVKEIRSGEYENMCAEEIAKIYDVCKNTILDVLSFKTWKQVS